MHNFSTHTFELTVNKVKYFNLQAGLKVTWSWHLKNEVVITLDWWWSYSCYQQALGLPLPHAASFDALWPSFVGSPPPYTPVQLSLWNEQPALATSSPACQPSLGSFVFCYEWSRCVLFAFPFVDKPFILVCVVDWCLEPKWHARWQGNASSDELPAVLSFPRACVAGAVHWPSGDCWGFCCCFSFFHKKTNHFWVALLFLIHFNLFNDQNVIIWFVYSFMEIVIVTIHKVDTIC